VIPDIDIWRAATLMLKRYGENAHQESAAQTSVKFEPYLWRAAN
jgi:hypothetical protein